MSVFNNAYCIHNIILIDKNKNYAGQKYDSTGQNSYGFSIPDNIEYVRAIIRNVNSSTEITLNEVEIAQPQLEKGTTATTPYIPHEEQTATFPLEEGQYMAKGDYLANNGIHHKKGRDIFDGSDDENWAITNSGTDNFFYRFRYLNSRKAQDLQTNELCNRAIGTNISSSNTNNGFSITASNEFRLRFGTEMTLANFKTWLANNQIKIEYELVTETIEPYTQAQQEAYNEIQKLMSYKGVTHISQENDNLPFNLKVVYRKDLEMILTSLDSRIKELENEGE